ncbi:MAG: 2-enoyl thioester reductase domain-containing protein [Verrucomicrobiales bacterium]|jgi:trans-2-enoyl-CoA reductase|nr:2-enoyl thioester reductase domain-containing protein [Verrucomicrobiales bacterium]
MSTTLTARYAAHGNPVEVIELAGEQFNAPADGEISVRMMFAPLNPSDINMLEGTYGVKAALPAVGGNEGVGRVEAVGVNVSGFAVGDWVKPPGARGTWRQALTVIAAECVKLPASLSAEQAAMIYVNPPTAWRMLHDFVTLADGEWIIQNAANSAVGRCVIQIAKALGWRTINLVRREDVVDELKALGGDIVNVETPDTFKQIKTWTGGQFPRLALNAVGGDSAGTLSRSLGAGGKLVTYGGMSKQPVKLATGPLIFKDLSYHGFWMTRWYATHSPAERDEMYAQLAKLFADDQLKIAVEKIHPLVEIKSAIASALQEKRGGKILLDLK